MISEATTILIMITNKAFFRSCPELDFCEDVHVDWFRGSAKSRLEWRKEREGGENGGQASVLVGCL